MSDNEKTEQPSEYKLQQAHIEGEYPKSQELIALGSFIAFIVMMGIFTYGVGHRFMYTLSSIFVIPYESNYIQNLSFTWEITILFILCISPIILFSIIIQYAQVGFVFNIKGLMPNFKRIDPLSNLKNIFSQMHIELAKTILKMIVITGVCIAAIYPYLLQTLISLVNARLEYFVSAITQSMLLMTLCVILITCIIAVLDYTIKRIRFFSKMMMTKEEVKEEQKQQEGSSETKARVRKVMNKLASKRKRAIQAVNESSFLLANPSHYSLAIKYDSRQYTIPWIVMKGENDLAILMRRTAERMQIPRIISPRLTRAIYFNSDNGQFIPERYYSAIAKVIAYLENANYPDRNIELDITE